MNNSPPQIEEIVRQVLERLGSTTALPRLCTLCPYRGPRTQILEVCRLMYERRLSDAAGGNISLRRGNHVYITPRYMGEKHRWDITCDDIILCTLDQQVLEGDPNMISREGDCHFGIYKSFPEVGAVIHAHPANILPFTHIGKPMPTVTAMTDYFGLKEVPIIRPVPAGTPEMAQEVVQQFQRTKADNPQGALVCMIPHHGAVVAGRDLDHAYVILESVETNARTLILAASLKEPQR